MGGLINRTATQSSTAYHVRELCHLVGHGCISYETTGYVGDNGGHMMANEMVILKEINDRLLSNPSPAYELYVRPEGTTLVGE